MGIPASPKWAWNHCRVQTRDSLIQTQSGPRRGLVSSSPAENNKGVKDPMTRVQSVVKSLLIAACAHVSVLSAGTLYNVYVSEVGGDFVSVIDPTTNKVSASIYVPSAPTGIAVSPDGSTAYVA